MGLLSFASVRQTIVSSAVIASVVLGTACGAQAATRKRPQVGGYSPPTAAIVVDAKTGKVLFAENPDAPRHPASVTKVMTLYLLFEQLDRGKMTLSTELKVSAHAQRQAPSKLGVSAGDTITVEDAIKALVTRSANDVASVIAENIGGTESNFAQLMTRKARAIGMSHTVYKNASGLPDPGRGQRRCGGGLLPLLVGHSPGAGWGGRDRRLESRRVTALVVAPPVARRPPPSPPGRTEAP
jgi:D-alanyl-D-alanine carboxypeptidase